MMNDPNYRMLHITDIPPLHVRNEQRAYGFSQCSSRHCPDAPEYVLFTTVMRWGYLHERQQRLCPAHAATWCAKHHIALADVPSIPFWDARDTTRPTPSWVSELLPVLAVH